MNDKSLYIHKHIKSLSKDNNLKIIFVELENRAIVKVPFDVVYKNDKSFANERYRLHTYVQNQYEEMKKWFYFLKNYFVYIIT